VELGGPPYAAKVTVQFHLFPLTEMVWRYSMPIKFGLIIYDSGQVPVCPVRPALTGTQVPPTLSIVQIINQV
jgi:hypothetical protein